MNHLESTFAGKNHIWRYTVMIFAILLASNTIGALPILIAATLKSISNPDVFTQLAANPNDFSVIGLDPNVGLIMMLFPFMAGLAAYIFLIKPLNNRSFISTITGAGKIRWNRFFISALIWILLSGLYLVVYLKVDPSNFTINNKSISILILIVVSVMLIPFQAAFEEVIFRGYLMQGFSALIRQRWFPLIMTSLLFGAMHAFNPEVKEYGFLIMMPQYILFGLIFGVITIMDDGIEAALGAHTANNVFLCIMVTNKSSALQTPAFLEQHNVYPWAEFAGLLFTGLALILLLKMIYKWSDFSLLWKRIEG